MGSAKLGFCCGVMLAVCVPAAFAAGDAAKGADLARDVCARCHNVEPNGPFKDQPPSFAAMAVYRTDEQIFGRIVFPPLHAGMPEIGYRLTPENVDHLVAYIRSLEAR